MNIVVFITTLTVALASVTAKKGFGPGEQEWGYVDVRIGAHMFWWLYKTTADVNDFTERPLVIWLQGGPGASSTGYGNFAEIGPLDYNLNERNTTWVKNYNVLFVDNPVGTGFSYTDSYEQLTTSNAEIASDFLALVQGFYQAIPELSETPLYIFSESYGGKMTAEIGYVLYKAIENGTLNANLKGVGLGDGWVSPIDSVLTWAPYLLNLGFVDQDGYEQIQNYAEQTKEALDNGQYSEATTLWQTTEMIISQLTYGVDFYNVLKKIPYYSKESKERIFKPSTRDEEDQIIEALMNSQVKEALDLTVTWGEQSGTVFSALSVDFMKPATEIVEKILNETSLDVAVYSGQLDLIVDTPGTIKWVDELHWEGAPSWKNADRDPVVVDNIIEGFVKKLDHLAFYWVNRAGHMVPADNPAATHYILDDIIKGYGKK